MTATQERPAIADLELVLCAVKPQRIGTRSYLQLRSPQALPDTLQTTRSAS